MQENLCENMAFQESGSERVKKCNAGKSAGSKNPKMMHVLRPGYL